MDYLLEKYPNILTKSQEYNRTYYGLPIEYYKISLDENKNITNKKSILFNGAHHAREPVSYTMTLYIMTNLISEVINNNPLVKEVLRTVDVYFIPVVNKDGVYLISREYYKKQRGELEYIRKNGRPGKIFEHCYKDASKSILYEGVDLNRNYDSHFGENNEGSSDDPCDESYRGEYAFSEPETFAMKKIVEEINENTGNGLKIAYNYHAWGNMIIIPPNFLRTDPIEYIEKNFHNEHIIYQKIINQGNFPSKFILGNGYKTVK